MSERFKRDSNKKNQYKNLEKSLPDEVLAPLKYIYTKQSQEFEMALKYFKLLGHHKFPCMQHRNIYPVYTQLTVTQLLQKGTALKTA